MAAQDARSLLTASEAAERLGVGYSTIKQWIYRGVLRTTQTAGGHHRIAASEIERLLARQNRPHVRQGRTPAAPVIVAISGRNQLRGVVDEIRVSGVLAQVRLRIGDHRLTAVITRDAVDELRLQRGDEAIAIVKATEVMIARGGSAPPDGLSARRGMRRASCRTRRPGRRQARSRSRPR